MNQFIEKCWGLFRKFCNRETVSYLIFGFATTFVNLGIFHGLFLTGLDYRWANLAALLGAKVFAYITNKLFVFRTRSGSLGELLKEMVRFIFARGFTGLLDYFGLIFAVEILGLNSVICKYALQMIVIILNYILGKKTVFTKGKQPESQEG